MVVQSASVVVRRAPVVATGRQSQKRIFHITPFFKYGYDFKLEYRNPKSETNSNSQNSNDQNKGHMATQKTYAIRLYKKAMPLGIHTVGRLYSATLRRYSDALRCIQALLSCIFALASV